MKGRGMWENNIKTWILGPDDAAIEMEAELERYREREAAADKINMAISKFNQEVEKAYAEYRRVHSQAELDHDCSLPLIPSHPQRPFVSAYSRDGR